MENKKFPTQLIVLGNGFNLGLGLPTKYLNYKQFLEKNSKLYPNCLKMFKLITNVEEDLEGNELEDDMFNFLSRYKKWNSEGDIDILLACDEKNKSLNAGVDSIRVKFSDEIIQLQLLFNKLFKTNTLYIWDFNYVIDGFKETKQYKIVTINTIGQAPKRAFTQLHYRSNQKSDFAEILFGGDWTETEQFQTSQQFTLNDLAYFRFCSKFFSKNLNPIHRGDIESSAASFGGDFPSNPKHDHLYDATGLPTSNFSILKSFYIVGFSLGKQDIQYFSNTEKNNPILHTIKNKGKFILSYYDAEGYENINNQGNYLKDNYFENIFEFTKFEKTETCIKNIFKEFYSELETIKDNIAKKQSQLTLNK